MPPLPGSDVRYVPRPPAALAAFFRSPQGALAKLLLGIAQDIEGKAKRYTPVDTGRLRSSLTSVVSSDGEGLYAMVGTDVEYAPYVEFGTYRTRPQSFLRRAIDEVSRGV